jgi:hypothetical protein
MIRRCRNCASHGEAHQRRCPTCGEDRLDDYCDIHNEWVSDGHCNSCLLALSRVPAATGPAARTRSSPLATPGPGVGSAPAPVSPRTRVGCPTPNLTAALWAGAFCGAVLALGLRLWLASVHTVSLSVPATIYLSREGQFGAYQALWWHDVPVAALGLVALAVIVIMVLPHRRS